MRGRADVILLQGVTIADVARALRGSGLGLSNGAFETLFVISRVEPRFPAASNVIDLSAELPRIFRRQAGPEHDVKGVDYDVVHTPDSDGAA